MREIHPFWQGSRSGMFLQLGQCERCRGQPCGCLRRHVTTSALQPVAFLLDEPVRLARLDRRGPGWQAEHHPINVHFDTEFSHVLLEYGEPDAQGTSPAMSRNRSRFSAPPYYRPSSAVGLQYEALVDLIDREGHTLSRRSDNVLRQLCDTLEGNIREARVVLGSSNQPDPSRLLAERLVAAEAEVARLQHEANAAYTSVPLPWRWFTGVPREPRDRLRTARAELQVARMEWGGLRQDQGIKRSMNRRPPLDTELGARAYLTRAEQARTVLHSAMLPGSRQIDREQDKIDLNRAKAAAYEDRVRQDADTVKPTLQRTHPCPYCGGPLGADAHADHIHPVSRGGLSTRENMVYACQSCNNKKHDLTIKQFATKYGRDRDEIEERLEHLGKRV
jgi:5-methylcytosine-specific restriction endonuclease McrA